MLLTGCLRFSFTVTSIFHTIFSGRVHEESEERLTSSPDNSNIIQVKNCQNYLKWIPEWILNEHDEKIYMQISGLNAAEDHLLSLAEMHKQIC